MDSEILSRQFLPCKCAHTETMSQITYKAFGKKIQNPGAVITAQTFLWAWREDGKHLAVKSINKALEMVIFTKVAPNKQIHLLMIRYNIFRRLSSLVRNVLTTRWSLSEGNFAQVKQCHTTSLPIKITNQDVLLCK